MLTIILKWSNSFYLSLLFFFLRLLGNKLRYLTSQIRQLAQDYVVNNGNSQDSNLGSNDFGKELLTFVFCIPFCHSLLLLWLIGLRFSSVAQSCPTLCDPVNRSTPGVPVHHQLPEFTQIHIHWVGDAIQPSHPLSSPPAPTPSQHQGLFQWVISSHEVAKVLEFQL